MQRTTSHWQVGQSTGKHQLGKSDQFHAGTKNGGDQHLPANPMAQQIHVVEGALKVNDRLLLMSGTRAQMALRDKKQMLQVEHAKRPQNDTT